MNVLCNRSWFIRQAILAFGEEEVCTAAGTQVTGNCSKAIALYSRDLNNNNQNFG